MQNLFLYSETWVNVLPMPIFPRKNYLHIHKTELIKHLPLYSWEVYVRARA